MRVHLHVDFFFHSKYCSAARLAHTEWWVAEHKLHMDFRLHGRPPPLTPELFKGHLYRFFMKDLLICNFTKSTSDVSLVADLLIGLVENSFLGLRFNIDRSALSQV